MPPEIIVEEIKTALGNEDILPGRSGKLSSRHISDTCSLKQMANLRGGLHE